MGTFGKKNVNTSKNDLCHQSVGSTEAKDIFTPLGHVIGNYRRVESTTFPFP